MHAPDRQPPASRRRHAGGLVLALAACSDGTPPEAAPRDTTPPTVEYRIGLGAASPFAIEGQATDDRGVAAIEWALAELVNSVPGPDVVRGAVVTALAGGRVVPFRIEVPARESGSYRLVITVRDSAGNVGSATVPRLDYGPPRPVVTAQVRPAGDTIRQRGIEVSATLAAGARMRQLQVYVDSGTPAQTVTTYDFARFAPEGVPAVSDLPVAVATPGVHTITVVARGTSTGRDGSARLSRTFVIAEAAYAATALPDLGGGANARALSAGGDVAGWVAAAGGRKRAAVWRGGELRVLPLADTTDVVATRVNDAGDVLLQPPPNFLAASLRGVRVLRADGTVLTVGPLTATQPSWARGREICCDLAADLTEGRRAVGTTFGVFPSRSAVLDVATGRLVDSSDARLLTMNARGQAAGTLTSELSYGLQGRELVAVGFTPSSRPPGPTARQCDPIAGRWTTFVPIDLDDDTNLLASWCDNPVYLPAAGVGTWLDRLLGQITAVRMSPRGGWVVALDSAGALHTWRPGVVGVARVRVAGDPWRFDSLGAVNAAGAIAAHGVERATGRGIALLLTPR